MHSICILYATREGQTRRIAEHVAAELRGRGFAVTVTNVRDYTARSNLNACTAAILAASVHVGPARTRNVTVRQGTSWRVGMPADGVSFRHPQRGRSRAVRHHPRRAFPVRSRRAKVLDRFFAETGWHPEHVKPVAGALLYTHYNFLIRFVMKHIAKQAGGSTDTSRDHEYTDWVALDRFVAALVEEFSAAKLPCSQY